MLSAGDIFTLNAARDVLSALEKECGSRRWLVRESTSTPDGFDFGKLAEAADNATGAIFNVLNVARAYCSVEISGEQMHNRKSEEVEASV